MSTFRHVAGEVQAKADKPLPLDQAEIRWFRGLFIEEFWAADRAKDHAARNRAQWNLAQLNHAVVECDRWQTAGRAL